MGLNTMDGKVAAGAVGVAKLSGTTTLHFIPSISSVVFVRVHVASIKEPPRFQLNAPDAMAPVR